MKIIKIFLSAMMISSSVWAGEKVSLMCNLEQENPLFKQRDIERRHSPCSTFKPILSLIGFEENVLQDTTHPQWEWKDSYKKKAYVVNH